MRHAKTQARGMGMCTRILYSISCDKEKGHFRMYLILKGPNEIYIFLLYRSILIFACSFRQLSDLHKYILHALPSNTHQHD